MENNGIFVAFFLGRLAERGDLTLVMCFAGRVDQKQDIRTEVLIAMIIQTFGREAVIAMALKLKTDKEFEAQSQKRLDEVLEQEIKSKQASLFTNFISEQ